MATYTENLNLEKPDLDDFYDVTKRNDNYDKIDEAIGNLDDDMKDHKTDPDTHANLKHYVKKAGDTMTGALTVSTGDNKNITLDDGNIILNSNHNIHLSDSNGQLVMMGANKWNEGAGISLYGKDDGGAFTIHSVDADKKGYELAGFSNGSLTWNNKNIVRSVNGVNADGDGNVQTGFPSSSFISATLPNNATDGGIYFTAPANGFILINGMTNDDAFVSSYTHYILVFSDKLKIKAESMKYNEGVFAFMPITKGDTVQFYTVKMKEASYRFIYAKGEEP